MSRTKERRGAKLITGNKDADRVLERFLTYQERKGAESLSFFNEYKYPSSSSILRVLRGILKTTRPRKINGSYFGREVATLTSEELSYCQGRVLEARTQATNQAAHEALEALYARL
jgi:hypothetical protein